MDRLAAIIRPQSLSELLQNLVFDDQGDFALVLVVDLQQTEIVGVRVCVAVDIGIRSPEVLQVLQIFAYMQSLTIFTQVTQSL